MIPIRDANPAERFPLLTIALIVINTIVFVLHWEGDRGLSRSHPGAGAHSRYLGRQ